MGPGLIWLIRRSLDELILNRGGGSKKEPHGVGIVGEDLSGLKWELGLSCRVLPFFSLNNAYVAVISVV